MLQYKPLDLVGDAKARDYIAIKNKSLITTMFEDPQIVRQLEYADYLLTHHFEESLFRKAHDRSLFEIFSGDFIISKLYGLELHRIKESFARFGNRIKVEGFVLIIMRLYPFQLDEVPYVINGLRELGEELAIDGLVTFEQFVAYYMNYGELETDNKEGDISYTVRESKFQDALFRRQEIQKAIHCKSIQKLAVMEENQSEVQLLGMDLKFFRTIRYEEEDIHHIILDFDYSEPNKEFCCSLSCNTLLFVNIIDQIHSRQVVKTDHLITRVHFLMIVGQWATLTTNQSLDLWLKRQDQCYEPKRLALNFQGGKVQNIIEIPKNDMICFQTDMKRVHLFNSKLDQLVIIQDSLLIQTFLYHEPAQCFYSINYTHKVQKWFIEENGVDYSKDKVIEICKPEFAVLCMGFVRNLVVTYDTSQQIRVFASDDFRKLACFKKVLKPTNRMRLFEIAPYQFVIVGNRMNAFDIEVVSENQALKTEQEQQILKDYEVRLRKTKDLIQLLNTQAPNTSLRHRSTKQQDQMQFTRETIMSQIQGAKSQMLPKIKQVKEFPNADLIDQKTIRDYLDEIDKNAYNLKLMSDRVHASDAAEHAQQNINLAPGGMQRINNLKQAFLKIDTEAEQPSTSVKQLNKTKRSRNMMETTKFGSMNESHKKTLSIINTEDALLSNQQDDYLNVYLTKKDSQQSINFRTRYEYQTQRSKVKKSLFLSLYRPQKVLIPKLDWARGQEFKSKPKPPAPMAALQGSPTSSQYQLKTNRKPKRPRSPPAELPKECLNEWRRTQAYFHEAVQAMEFMERQAKYI